MSFKVTIGGTSQLELDICSKPVPGFSFSNDMDTGFYRADMTEWYLRNARTAFELHLKKYDIEESFLRQMKELFPEEFI